MPCPHAWILGIYLICVITCICMYCSPLCRARPSGRCCHCCLCSRCRAGWRRWWPLHVGTEMAPALLVVRDPGSGPCWAVAVVTVWHLVMPRGLMSCERQGRIILDALFPVGVGLVRWLHLKSMWEAFTEDLPWLCCYLELLSVVCKIWWVPSKLFRASVALSASWRPQSFLVDILDSMTVIFLTITVKCIVLGPVCYGGKTLDSPCCGHSIHRLPPSGARRWQGKGYGFFLLLLGWH